jgi:hypothetical protein
VSDPISETTVYFQSLYCNDTVSSNQWSIYVNLQKVKQNGNLMEKEEERKRQQHINGVRDGALDKMELAWVKNGYQRN